jgi:hypothetical protein
MARRRSDLTWRGAGVALFRRAIGFVPNGARVATVSRVSVKASETCPCLESGACREAFPLAATHRLPMV